MNIVQYIGPKHKIQSFVTWRKKRPFVLMVLKYKLKKMLITIHVRSKASQLRL